MKLLLLSFEKLTENIYSSNFKLNFFVKYVWLLGHVVYACLSSSVRQTVSTSDIND